MNPARDTFLVTKFPTDPGLSREEIKARVEHLEKCGLRPAGSLCHADDFAWIITFFSAAGSAFLNRSILFFMFQFHTGKD